MNRNLVLILLAAVCFPALADTANTNNSKLYQMDLFSIISFALAIAALLLSGFMAWLSWELFKKSSDASDKTQQAVVRVEATVQSVQDDITEIVRRAVGYWIDGTGASQDSGQADDLDEKFKDLESQISKLAKTNPDAGLLEEKLGNIFNAQKAELQRLNSSLFDAKVRSIFPSAEKSPAARITQHISNNQPNLKDGRLIINVTKPVKNATATGQFTPQFTSVPELNVEIESSPYEDLSEVKLSSGVGVKSNFNVHVIAISGTLREGEYVIKYTATSKDA